MSHVAAAADAMGFWCIFGFYLDESSGVRRPDDAAGVTSRSSENGERRVGWIEAWRKIKRSDPLERND